MPFPDIDPVAFAIGPLTIRWYALAYIAGILLGWRLLSQSIHRFPANATPKDVADFVLWTILGIIVGGRLGYLLFYGHDILARDPSAAFAVWQGGMSFHGGLAGSAVAAWLFCRIRGLGFASFCDAIACVIPVGLFFGRVANFVNGELWGRPTDLPWGVVFPGAGAEPRHPSQLYEAALEGIVLFVVLRFLATRTPMVHRPGALAGVFLAGYACSRILVEFVREPDAHLGYLAGPLTMGMVLSIPVLIIGAIVWVQAYRRPGP
ncbi:MAG: prolipoprotein diacylglyceryl transferase [Rhodospirillales bacterium]|nr:prolipoprotein diacylglyceryl transferase [Rhodospirillales bacterium]